MVTAFDRLLFARLDIVRVQENTSSGCYGYHANLCVTSADGVMLKKDYGDSPRPMVEELLGLQNFCFGTGWDVVTK